jgi:hypothetical protein
MHGPADVVAAYREFAKAAIRQSGPPMTAAWGTPPLTAPAQVPLGTGYVRTDSDAKCAVTVAAMAKDLMAIGTWWRQTQ